MSYAVLKALHIIFVVTWFAGLFYIVRLLIYIQEGNQLNDAERNILVPQLKLMSRRLWMGITWPSAIITALLGTSLVWQIPGFLQQPWMHMKLLLVLLLYAYHGYTHCLVSQCLNDTCRMSSYGLRMWNELATLFLFGIVFLVVLKTTTNWVWFGGGLLLLTVGLTYAIAQYKKYRQKNEND